MLKAKTFFIVIEQRWKQCCLVRDSTNTAIIFEIPSMSNSNCYCGPIKILKLTQIINYPPYCCMIVLKKSPLMYFI